MQAAENPEDIYVERVALSSIQFADRNPKDHDDALIRGSFEFFGFVAPPMIDEATGKLVYGHGRIEELRAMKAAGEDPPFRIRVDPATGEWLVPILRGVRFASDRQAEMYLLADNKISEAGGWIREAVAEVLKDYDAEEANLVGFSDAELEGMVSDGIAMDAPRTNTTENEEETLHFRGVRLLISAGTGDRLEQHMKAYAQERGTYNGFVEYINQCLTRHSK